MKTRIALLCFVQKSSLFLNDKRIGAMITLRYVMAKIKQYNYYKLKQMIFKPLTIFCSILNNCQIEFIKR